MLEIPFDPHKLYRADEDEALWFSWLVDRVDVSRREQHERMKKAQQS